MAIDKLIDEFHVLRSQAAQVGSVAAQAARATFKAAQTASAASKAAKANPSEATFTAQEDAQKAFDHLVKSAQRASDALQACEALGDVIESILADDEPTP